MGFRGKERIELNEEKKDYIVNVIMSWIDREMKNN